MREWSCCHGLCGNLHPLIVVMEDKFFGGERGRYSRPYALKSRGKKQIKEKYVRIFSFLFFQLEIINQILNNRQRRVYPKPLPREFLRC